MAKSRIGIALAALAFVGCASTEFFNEGPGQPTDRASGQVPAGSIGVCKLPKSSKPPIVNPALWEHAAECNGKTPREFIRLGYDGAAPNADAQIASLMEAVAASSATPGGTERFAKMIRGVRGEALKSQSLAVRVAKESSRASACDASYMLNTMQAEHDRLFAGDKCAARAFDPKEKKDACIFDVESEQAVWLTSAWDCVAFTGAAGESMSCHRLCSYDDYCAQQVSCTAPDLDLLLCRMGVCVPGPASPLR